MREINNLDESILEVRNLSVTYSSGKKTVYAVNNVDLKIGKKETLGIVGETGAGKTTLALSILKLLPEVTGKITSGTIKFGDIDITKLNDDAMRAIRGAQISMIFQDPMTSLNPTVTVGNQIKEAIVLHNYDNKDKNQINNRVNEILSLVGIRPDRKESYPHEFSGGMKQRIVIAIALACSPNLLIADEPTTALDVTIQAQVLAMIDELKQSQEMSMILITHDLGVVAKTCDYVAVMYAGEIVEYGLFEDIFKSNNHHPYTKGLFDCIPNIKSDDKWLKPIKGLMPDPTKVTLGCKFSDRCTQCMEICKTEHPKDYKNGTHVIKCHLYE